MNTETKPALSYFVLSALCALPAINDSQDRQAVIDGLSAMERKGYSLADAIAFSGCLEDVNPELDENEALARMSAIQEKYGEHPLEGLLVGR